MKLILWCLIVLACLNVIPLVDASEKDEMAAMQKQLNEKVMAQDFTLQESQTITPQPKSNTNSNTSCEDIKHIDPESYQACVILHTVYGPLYNRTPR